MIAGRLFFLLQPVTSAILWVALAAFPVSAAEVEDRVTLTARDGTLSVEGSLLGFDGTYLRIATVHGELTVAYDAVSCDGAACPDLESYVPLLRLSGAARLGEVILPALVDGYARAHQLASELRETGDGRTLHILSIPESGEEVVRFSFRLTSTEDGFADLLANEADMAMAERPLTPEELALARDAGLGQLDAPGRLRLIALDALVPIVAPGQTISALSVSQLSRIFAGEVTNWSRLGGADRPITLHLGPAESGQMQGFETLVLARSGRQISDEVIRHPTEEALSLAVAVDPGAIGISPFGEIGNAQPVALTGPCGLRSAARPETVMTGDFPLTLPLVLYQPMRRPPPVVDEFLAWIATTDAQMVLRRAGVAGLSPLPIPLSQQGDRLAGAIRSAGKDVTLEELKRMVTALESAQRLSPTFRFETGSTQLDAVSQSNALQLAQSIRDGRHRGEVLMLIGFSDGRGPASVNLDLAQERAETVRAAILELLGGELPPDTALEVDAYGEALPMGCDASETGRQINRRVELWTRALP